jgi:hypothetical protein
MSRPRNTIPTYRKHKLTGRAAVSIYRTDGSPTEVILPGEFGSEQSRQEYERLLCQLRANGGRLPAENSSSDLTIAEVIEKFMAHAETYLRRSSHEATNRRGRNVPERFPTPQQTSR